MGAFVLMWFLMAGDSPARQFTLVPGDATGWLRRLGVPSGAERRHTTERLMILSPTGEVLATLDGGHGHVDVPPDVAAALDEPGAELVLVHNHPAGTGLSQADLGQLSRRGVGAIVAIGHDRSMYVARRGPRFPEAGTLRTDLLAYQQARAAAVREARGEPSLRLRELFDRQLAHVVALSLAATGMIDYHADLGPDRALEVTTAGLFLSRSREAAVRAVR